MNAKGTSPRQHFFASKQGLPAAAKQILTCGLKLPVDQSPHYAVLTVQISTAVNKFA